jgi:plasmid maintenance system antidote protein VapI
MLTRRSAWRFGPPTGATAAELAEIVGLSLQRVHQLVAGARK